MRSEIRVIKSHNYAFSWDEIQRIISIARKENITVYTLIITLAYSGRRITEIVGEEKRAMVKVYWVNENGRVVKDKWKIVLCPVKGLLVRDIDFENGVIDWCIEKKIQKIREPNSWEKPKRVYATLPAHPKLLEVLKEYIDTKGLEREDKLFPFTRQHAYRLVKKVIKKANIHGKERILHAFRHGFAITVLKKGSTPYDLRSLQNLLQHSSIDLTMEYTRFAKGDERKLLERLE